MVAMVALLTSCGSRTTPAAQSAPDVDGRTFLSTGVTVGGADRALVAGSVIRLAFADGGLTVSANCNTMSGKVRFDGSRMTLPDGLAMTEMGCSPELMAQDRWLASLLTAGSAVTLRDQRLVLVSGSTEIAMQALV